MKPLQFSRYLLSLLCIYSAEDSADKWILFRNRLFGILTELHLLLAAVAAASASYKYSVVDFESALYAFPECVALSLSNYTFIRGFISRKEIREMFDSLQGIYDTCESPHSSILIFNSAMQHEDFICNFISAHTDKEKDLNHFMVHADQRGTQTAKFFVKYFAGVCPTGILLVSFFSMIYSRLTYGYFNPDVLYHPAVIL